MNKIIFLSLVLGLLPFKAINAVSINKVNKRFYEINQNQFPEISYLTYLDDFSSDNPDNKIILV